MAELLRTSSSRSLRSNPKSQENVSLPTAEGEDEKSEPEHSANDPLVATSVRTKVQVILKVMERQGIGLDEFLDALLWGDPECYSDTSMKNVRQKLCTSSKLPEILDRLHTPPRTKSKGYQANGARGCMDPWALKITTEIFSKGLAALAKSTAKLPSEDMSEATLNKISLDTILNDMNTHTPTLLSTLQDSVEIPNHARRIRKTSLWVVVVIISMLCHQRSADYSELQKLLSIWFKAKAVPAKAFDLLQSFGLCMSYSWSNNTVLSIRNNAIADMREHVKENPFMVLYDNVRLKFAADSQRSNNQDHKENGTAATVIILPSSSKAILRNWKEHRREMERQHAARVIAQGPIAQCITLEALTTDHLRRARLRECGVHHIMNVLLRHPAFSKYLHHRHQSLQPPKMRFQLPTGPEHRTKQFMLSTMPLEEASYNGNLQVVEEIMKQVEADQEKERVGLEIGVPYAGDNLTIARLRGLLNMRSEDRNSYDRWEWMILIPGWFHINMATGVSIWKNYRGTTKSYGLARAVKMLKRKGFNQDKPYWHHLDKLIEHLWTAHTLDGWLEVSGQKTLESLAEWASAQDDPSSLLALADKLMATLQSTEGLTRASIKSPPDHQLEESIMFCRDALSMHITLQDAIKRGDVGILEDIMPELLTFFKGGGNRNYSLEMLETMQFYIYEADEPLRQFICENCFVVNLSGQPDGFEGADMLQEHNVCAIKSTHAAQGLNTNWEYIEKISPAVPTYQSVSKHVEATFGLCRHGSHHSTLSADEDIAMLFNQLHKGHVHHYNDNGRVLKACSKDLMKCSTVELSDSTYLDDWWNNCEWYRINRSKLELYNLPPTNKEDLSGKQTGNKENDADTMAALTLGDLHVDDWDFALAHQSIEAE